MNGAGMKPGYKQTEVGVIPADWDVRRLTDLTTEIGDGIHATPEYTKSSEYYFINGNNLLDGTISITVGTMSVSEAEWRKLRKNLTDQTILLSINGTIGNLAFFRGEKVVLGKSAAYLNVASGISSEYIFYCLSTSSTAKYFENELTGTTIRNLSLSSLRNTPIAIPKTTGEQSAIATALSDVDALIRSLDQLIDKKRALKQAAMQQLLTGKTRLPGFSGAWEVTNFGESFQFLNTANNPRSDLSAMGDLGYVHYGDIHMSNAAFLDCDRVDLPRISQHSISNIPCIEDGDLIMVDASEDCAGLGKSVEVLNTRGRGIVAGLHTYLLRGRKELLADNFKCYLQSVPSVISSLNRFATGISVYSVSKNNLKSIEFPLPPLREQIAIAAILSDMDAEIAALEQRRDKIRALKQGMMQELLTGRIRLK